MCNKHWHLILTDGAEVRVQEEHQNWAAIIIASGIVPIGHVTCHIADKANKNASAKQGKVLEWTNHFRGEVYLHPFLCPNK